MSKKIKTYFYNSRVNFGDALNIYLLKHLFNIDIVKACAKSCKMVCIGSLLEIFVTPPMKFKHKIRKIMRPQVLVWGTGFIKEDTGAETDFKRKMNIKALRGKTSLERAKKYLGKDLPDIVLGDPGLLANRLIDTKKIEKKYKLGIIPHYVDKDNPLLNNIQVENAIVIDIEQNPMDFLKQVAECECIISSAMHGLIAADSLGVPNVRMVLSDKIIGGDYKFRDYYSAFDMDLPDKIVMTSNTQITSTDFIKENYKITPDMVEKICQNLLRVFPYKKRI